MHIEQAHSSEISTIVSVLQEAAQCFADDGKALWSQTEIGQERVSHDTQRGLFYLAREKDEVTGVMKFELEDPYFWPEVATGSSAFIHKLAVRRAWAKKGVSTALLAFARARTESLGRAHLRLDCVADRLGPRKVYEGFGFTLHSYVQRGTLSFARYELEITRELPNSNERFKAR